MRKSNTITNFHKNAPRRLIALYKRNKGNCYLTAKAINVNPSHVWQLLRYGKEPKRDDLRRKLFLPHKKTPEELEIQKQTRREKERQLPDFIKKFRKLPRGEQYKVMQQYIKWKESTSGTTE